MRLNKETASLELVDRLNLQTRDWVVVDHWDADRCAIGIARRGDERRLVYVSCFDQEPGKYNYECETPDGPDLDDYRTTGEGQSVEFADLVRRLEDHLNQ